MNLSGLFQYGNRNLKSRNTGKVQIQNNSSNSSSSHAVRNLSTGQTIQGEVVSKNGNEVQIRVDNRDVVISAKLDADMNVSVGQSMTFEVKNGTGSQIALRPLYENLTSDGNVLKALEAAKLPATNEMVRMVSAMMENGMSIDKSALTDMSRLVMSNQGTDPKTIVMMKNFQIPITPENIGQFENYERYEHQILSSVTDILMEIPQTFAAMVNGGNENAAIDFYMQILQLFGGDQAVGGENINAAAGGNVFADIIEETIGAEGENVPIADNGNDAAVSRPEAGVLQETYIQAKGEMSESLLGMGGKEGQETPDGIKEAPDGGGYSAPLGDSLNIGERYQLAASLGRLGFLPEQLQQIRDGNMPIEQLLKNLQSLLAEKGDSVNKEELLKLFGSKEYGRILNQHIGQQWTIRPEEVANKKDVEALYNRLRQQTMRLTESLGQAAKDTPLAKSLTTVQNNIDFMNQLNQMFNYIQLPLKMSGGEAHGDLYVYTNKKSAVREDGSVSALLHLDMDHLGPLDVYVVLKEQRVNTQFYLQDESMIDFIADHIHILNERLEKRGYSMHAEMKVREDEKETVDVMKKITAQESRSALLAQYAFDVRA
ncbi:hypothetical protein C807_01121 [Lachnospiraceae bacterium 28-4]|nr:hypothetical protein C807_01121 [Lachnospiraceae bacterium 28-4]